MCDLLVENSTARLKKWQLEREYDKQNKKHKHILIKTRQSNPCEVKLKSKMNTWKETSFLNWKRKNLLNISYFSSIIHNFSSILFLLLTLWKIGIFWLTFLVCTMLKHPCYSIIMKTCYGSNNMGINKFVQISPLF